jgi:hypothetical protein
MIKLVVLQIVAGALAGWALEYMLRTGSRSAAFGIRWRALAAAVTGSMGYAYVLGAIIDDPELREFDLFLGAGVLLVAATIAFAISRRR